MTLSVNQNINRAQAFKGISPLNAAYLNINGDDKQQQSQVAAPAKAQLIEPLQTTQGYAPENASGKKRCTKPDS